MLQIVVQNTVGVTFLGREHLVVRLVAHGVIIDKPQELFLHRRPDFLFRVIGPLEEAPAQVGAAAAALLPAGLALIARRGRAAVVEAGAVGLNVGRCGLRFEGTDLDRHVRVEEGIYLDPTLLAVGAHVVASFRLAEGGITGLVTGLEGRLRYVLAAMTAIAATVALAALFCRQPPNGQVGRDGEEGMPTVHEGRARRVRPQQLHMIAPHMQAVVVALQPLVDDGSEDGIVGCLP